MHHYDGLIKMNFVSRGGRTVADRIYREGNSRVSAAIQDTGKVPVYFLISTGGGFIEGESYLQDIALEPQSHAVITTQTPNYVYKCANNRLTKQETVLSVGEGALLECYLDEVVPYNDARYFQGMSIHLDKGASLILTDGLTAGWSHNEKPFQYRRVDIKTSIFKEDQLVLNDYLICNPEENNMEELGFFEGYTNFNSIIIIDDTITDSTIQQLQEQLSGMITDCRFGLTRVDDGLILRVLGKTYHENRRLLTSFINYYRETFKQLEPINLRKPDFKLK
ncbi:MAG: urease accessory protein UreD [Streptococcus parasanguinis]|jgi:ureD urease accessory protein|nr:urease accessory protein UreD [Streptococcus parasanguinis]